MKYKILKIFCVFWIQFIHKGNFDIYVIGSNSNLLSSEVDTEFGGRGDRIHLLPLSFLEYLSNVDLDKRDALD